MMFSVGSQFQLKRSVCPGDFSVSMGFLRQITLKWALPTEYFIRACIIDIVFIGVRQSTSLFHSRSDSGNRFEGHIGMDVTFVQIVFDFGNPSISYKYARKPSLSDLTFTSYMKDTMKLQCYPC